MTSAVYPAALELTDAPRIMTLKRWLIIRHGEECRVVTKSPVLDSNEVAIEITLKVPQPPRIVGAIDIQLPDPPPVQATATSAPFVNPLS